MDRATGWEAGGRIPGCRRRPAGPVGVPAGVLRRRRRCRSLAGHGCRRRRGGRRTGGRGNPAGGSLRAAAVPAGSCRRPESGAPRPRRRGWRLRRGWPRSFGTRLAAAFRAGLLAAAAADRGCGPCRAGCAHGKRRPLHRRQGSRAAAVQGGADKAALPCRRHRRRRQACLAPTRCGGSTTTVCPLGLVRTYIPNQPDANLRPQEILDALTALLPAAAAAQPERAAVAGFGSGLVPAVLLARRSLAEGACCGAGSQGRRGGRRARGRRSRPRLRTPAA